jgi:transketolase
MPPANDCRERRVARVSDPGTRWTAGDPAVLAARIRPRAVRMVRPQGFGYLGQALSSAEQVAALFTVMAPGEDRLVCSPGHYVIGLFAAHHRLSGLTVLLDANNSQVDGPADTITTIEPIAAKWEAFGWAAVELDGHDVGALVTALTRASSAENSPEEPEEEPPGKPTVLISRTSTAHGLRCLPPDADGHFIKLPPDLADQAEANMMGVAGALARDGFRPFVPTFGVFATRRPLDQIINAIAFPRLPVRIVGFMPGVSSPGVSSPGGPSHQAIDDVALMRAIPGMTVVDVADAVEAGQVARAIVDVDGPVYLRLKRGEIPVIFPAAWAVLGRPGPAPQAGIAPAEEGEYSPV